MGPAIAAWKESGDYHRSELGVAATSITKPEGRGRESGTRSNQSVLRRIRGQKFNDYRCALPVLGDSPQVSLIPISWNTTQVPDFLGVDPFVTAFTKAIGDG